METSVEQRGPAPSGLPPAAALAPTKTCASALARAFGRSRATHKEWLADHTAGFSLTTNQAGIAVAPHRAGADAPVRGYVSEQGPR